MQKGIEYNKSKTEVKQIERFNKYTLAKEYLEELVKKRKAKKAGTGQMVRQLLQRNFFAMKNLFPYTLVPTKGPETAVGFTMLLPFL